MLWNKFWLNNDFGMQIVKKVDLEAQRGPRQNQRRKRNPIDDLRREVSIMRTLRHKNIVSLQVCPYILVLCNQACSITKILTSEARCKSVLD